MRMRYTEHVPILTPRFMNVRRVRMYAMNTKWSHSQHTNLCRWKSTPNEPTIESSVYAFEKKEDFACAVPAKVISFNDNALINLLHRELIHSTHYIMITTNMRTIVHRSLMSIWQPPIDTFEINTHRLVSKHFALLLVPFRSLTPPRLLFSALVVQFERQTSIITFSIVCDFQCVPFFIHCRACPALCMPRVCVCVCSSFARKNE